MQLSGKLSWGSFPSASPTHAHAWSQWLDPNKPKVAGTARVRIQQWDTEWRKGSHWCPAASRGLGNQRRTSREQKVKVIREGKHIFKTCGNNFIHLFILKRKNKTLQDSKRITMVNTLHVTFKLVTEGIRYRHLIVQTIVLMNYEN